MVHNATLITCMPPQSGSGTVSVTVCTTVFVGCKSNSCVIFMNRYTLEKT